MDLLIKNAVIIDGTGESRYEGAVLVNGSRITKIIRKKELAVEYENQVKQVIDADGMVLAPGFIDTHSHSDLKVLSDPMLLPKLRQGITTEVLGQDGISMAPLPLKYIEPWKKKSCRT